MKSKTKLSMLLNFMLVLVMMVALLPTTAIAEGSTPATEKANFDSDPSAALALLNAYKTVGAEDSTWDSTTLTLTLNGIDFETTAVTALELPDQAIIVLHNENKITGGNGLSGYCDGIYVDGDLTIKGDGKLTITGGNGTECSSRGIDVYGGLVVESGEIIAIGGTAKFSDGIVATSNNVVINGGNVTAKGGVATDKSIGINRLMINGGTLIATGDTQALSYFNLSSFTNYWWRTSNIATYTVGSTTPYILDASHKYLEIRDTDPNASPVTTYTVTFNANGGTGTMSDVSGLTGTYTLPANGFTAPTGKKFKGWATSANGSIISGTTIDVTADTTLYAIWEDDNNEITTSNETTTIENPKTGDNIIMYIAIMLMSALGVSGTVVFIKKRA